MDTRPEPEPQPPPKGDALVKGAHNNSSPRQPPGADGAFPQSSFSADPKPIDQLGNESSVSSPVTQAESERQKKENEVMELEVGCDFYPFRRGIILTPSQRERKRKELEREKREKEARERREEFKVRRDLDLFQQSTILTTSQKRQRELEREKQENEARERKEEHEVCCNPHHFNRTPLQPHFRGKKDEGKSNARRKRRRLGNGRKSLR